MDKIKMSCVDMYKEILKLSDRLYELEYKIKKLESKLKYSK